MYYLQSRYYNPEWGRFINADEVDILKSLGNTNDELTDANLFVYGGNNPVMNLDPNGDSWFTSAFSKNPYAAALFIICCTLILQPSTFAFSKRQPILVPGIDAIPGLKRGNTEVIRKGRQKDNFVPRNNYRRPKKKKPHTSGAEHQKQFK